MTEFDETKQEFEIISKNEFEQWLQTEIKPRFCKTSENYFSGSHLKVQVKLPLKSKKRGSTYIGSRGYD